MKRCLTAFVLAVASVFGAAAQMRLSLDAAIELALSENPTIRIAEMEVARYDYVKRQTWGTLLPQVALNGQINHTFIKQNMSKGFSLGGDQYTTISGAVEATMPLFAPAVYRTLKMNDTQMAAAVEAARASRVDLVAEVRKAFYNILLAEQSLAVLLESQATVQRTVDDTELQYRNGLMSEYDLLTAQVQLSNLKPTIIQTENSIAVAKRLLKMYLSIPETVDIEVEGHLDALRDAVLEGTDGLSTDVSENTDLRALELQEELLFSNCVWRMPDVGRLSDCSETSRSRVTTWARSIFQDMSVVQDGYYWQNPLYAGVQLSVPLFAGLTKMNRSRELKNQLAQIGEQRDYLRRQIDVQVRSALNDLVTARETMFAQERTVEQARKAYGISDTRYRAGAGTILELNSAQLAQTQAQLNFSQAIYDYLMAKAEYDRIVGREK